MYGPTVAHKELPLGTKVALENPATGEHVTAIVTDRGPYIDGRDVDLSYGIARRLSLVEKGVAPLVMKVIG
jgi:rare lipoprotein A